MPDFVSNPEPGQPLPASTYAREAGASRRNALKGRVTTEVAIIGAGITGLSTAIALSRRGVATVVLEANEPGWGASGRNGGQVNPGLKHDPDTIANHFGPDIGEALVRLAWSAPDRVAEMVSKFAIDCDFVQAGTYRAAIGARSVPPLQTLSRQLARRGIKSEMHDAKRMAAVTGTDRYAAGLFMPQGGQLDPLRYTRGLARAAASLGAAVHGDSTVIAMQRHGEQWRLCTAGGEVNARRVLVATNGYSGPLIAGLRRSVLPVFSSLVASNPMPSSLAQQLLGGRQVLYEAGRVTTYYRVDAAGRLLFGGRGRMRPAQGPAAFQNLTAYAERLWPALRAVGWADGWNGRLAITADHYPHLHDLGDGRLVFLGYNGRGLAMATAIGEPLASHLVGEAARGCFPSTLLSPIRFQPFWRLGAVPVIALATLQDWLEAGGTTKDHVPASEGDR